MNIVVLDAATLAGVSLDPLREFGAVTEYDTTSAEQLMSRIQNAEVVVTNKVVLNADALSQLPNLRLICVAATGTNNIDLEAARAHNIAVTNVAGYSTPSVVLHTFTLLGNLMSNIHRYTQDCANGAWQRSDLFCRLDYPIHDLSGKRFVIVGYGNLGQAVAKVASAFGAEVVIAERPGQETVRAERVEFTEALRSADIVSIHCPLTDTTRDLFDADTLALLPAHAILLNTARGGIVNEQALADALATKQLLGAGVDVLSVEPAAADNPLVQYQGNNLLLTPHTAWASQESITRLIQGIAENIDSFLQGREHNRLV
ncbi:glycerate dehydrogenase [Pseudoalteromonas rubra]|uniref:Glycerate dehydrogenase n=1 Tax=Pseudoalteromonas rubra TaxID=43658 RepID=A0A5S3WU46_9GAMM|nr:D-2-hydroxyacid dehydrogenase [Pseudoalteromonas rubra]TMP29265.1 glycerate dehydrogenase [Pseudoalteromonas rubra]TMP32082.1 glycerate dehydrogenase [Pseudoalteromonas rubra]